MTVIVLTDCPPKLRGDLTKWLLEISTGVYVGKVSARVRDELWLRVCENLKNGRAAMVYSINNEQGMDFRVHNSVWEPVDYDGIKLVRRLDMSGTAERAENILKPGFSKAAKQQMARRSGSVEKRKTQERSYCVVDIETSGLDVAKDEIIEIAAIRVKNKEPEEELSILIKADVSIPNEIQKLTGLTNEHLEQQGIPLYDGLVKFKDFIGNDKIVCHNASFDYSFLLAACKKCGIPPMKNGIIDTLRLARQKVKGIENYKLGTLAKHFGISDAREHRALSDCRITYGIYINLNEN